MSRFAEGLGELAGHDIVLSRISRRPFPTSGAADADAPGTGLFAALARTVRTVFSKQEGDIGSCCRTDNQVDAALPPSSGDLNFLSLPRQSDAKSTLIRPPF